MYRAVAILLSLFVSPAIAFVTSPHAFVKNTRLPPPCQMVAIDTSDIKNGLTIEIDGEPYKVLSFSIMKQARGAAKTTIKFKNLMKGNTIENTYRSGEKFETAMIERNSAQFTYSDENGNYYFMDSQTFDEIVVGPTVMEGKEEWLGEGMEVSLVSFKNSVIEVVLPSNAVYTVVETAPNIEGKTKPATLSSGATINVPGYVEEGESISVDTEKKEFLGRA